MYKFKNVIKAIADTAIHRIYYCYTALFTCVLVCVIAFSCKREKAPEVEVKMHRYELALMEANPDSLFFLLPEFVKQYPIYLQGADISDTLNVLILQSFVNDPLVKKLYGEIEEYYGSGEDLEKKLAYLFSEAKKNIPDFRVPTVYTYISCLDYANRVIYNDSILSLSLDMYLPDRMELYSAYFPKYMAERFSQEALLVDVAKEIAVSILPVRNGTGSLLDEIVYSGKVMCIVDRLLPNIDEKTKLSYSEEQWNWCKKNESQVWKFWIEEQLLYEKNLIKIKNYINDGPGNIAFEGAPSRLVQYIGWRMLSSHIRKNAKFGEELWEKPSQDVLKESLYKP